jgi:hypothetical protein
MSAAFAHLDDALSAASSTEIAQVPLHTPTKKRSNNTPQKQQTVKNTQKQQTVK